MCERGPAARACALARKQRRCAVRRHSRECTVVPYLLSFCVFLFSSTVESLSMDSLKAAILGSAAVGKTALAARLCGRRPSPTYEPTHGLRVLQAVWTVVAAAQQQDSAEAVAEMDVELWDVGALSETVFGHDYLRQSALQDVSVVLICVSLTDRESFVEAKRIADLFDSIPGAGFALAKQHTPTLVVLTKCDLFMQVEVSRAEVEDFFDARGTRCVAVAADGDDADLIEIQRAIAAAARTSSVN